MCFYSNIFGHETRKILPFDRMLRIRKRTAALLVPALDFFMRPRGGGEKKLTFTSFFGPYRDDCYDLCVHLHKKHRPDLYGDDGRLIEDGAGKGDGSASAPGTPGQLPSRSMSGSASNRSLAAAARRQSVLTAGDDAATASAATDTSGKGGFGEGEACRSSRLSSGFVSVVDGDDGFGVASMYRQRSKSDASQKGGLSDAAAVATVSVGRHSTDVSEMIVEEDDGDGTPVRGRLQSKSAATPQPSPTSAAAPPASLMAGRRAKSSHALQRGRAADGDHDGARSGHQRNASAKIGPMAPSFSSPAGAMMLRYHSGRRAGGRGASGASGTGSDASEVVQFAPITPSDAGEDGRNDSGGFDTGPIATAEGEDEIGCGHRAAASRTEADLVSDATGGFAVGATGGENEGVIVEDLLVPASIDDKMIPAHSPQPVEGARKRRSSSPSPSGIPVAAESAVLAAATSIPVAKAARAISQETVKPSLTSEAATAESAATTAAASAAGLGTVSTSAPVSGPCAVTAVDSLPEAPPSTWLRFSNMKPLINVVLPVSVCEFHSLFLDDDASMPFDKYHVSAGNKEVNMTRWSPANGSSSGSNGMDSSTRISRSGSISGFKSGDGAARMPSTESASIPAASTTATLSTTSAPGRQLFTRTLRLIMPITGGGPFVAKQTAVEEMQRYMQVKLLPEPGADAASVIGSHRILILEGSATSFDVPYGDCFTTETAWIIAPVEAKLPMPGFESPPADELATANASSGGDGDSGGGQVERRLCRFIALVHLNFSKSTLFKGRIVSATESATKAFIEGYVKAMRTHIAADQSSVLSQRRSSAASAELLGDTAAIASRPAPPTPTRSTSPSVAVGAAGQGAGVGAGQPATHARKHHGAKHHGHGKSHNGIVSSPAIGQPAGTATASPTSLIGRPPRPARLEAVAADMGGIVPGLPGSEPFSPSMALALQQPSMPKDLVMATLMSPSEATKRSQQAIVRQYTQLYNAHAAAISQIRSLQEQVRQLGASGGTNAAISGAAIGSLSTAAGTGGGSGADVLGLGSPQPGAADTKAAPARFKSLADITVSRLLLAILVINVLLALYYLFSHSASSSGAASRQQLSHKDLDQLTAEVMNRILAASKSKDL